MLADDAGKNAGVYIKFHFDGEGQLDGAYCGESLEVLRRFRCEDPKSLHQLGHILAGVITRGDDLDKQGLAGLLIFRANLGRSTFQAMLHPSHNYVRCGALPFMVGNERVRVALKIAKSENVSALPQSERNFVEQTQAGNLRRRDAAQENAKFIAVFLSGINALQLVNVWWYSICEL